MKGTDVVLALWCCVMFFGLYVILTTPKRLMAQEKTHCTVCDCCENYCLKPEAPSGR